MSKPRNIGILGLLLLASFVSSASAAEREEGFRPLFDGESFAGWEGNLDWFRIQDNSIVAGSLKRAIPNNEFLCTEQEYGDFELRLQAKLVGEGKNAGVQFRSRRIPNHHEVIGYQCDMGSMPAGPIWGFLYDESRRRKFLDEGNSRKLAEVLRPDGWNDLRIRCENDRIQIWVNGYQTVDYTERDATIERRGIIGLQIHSGSPAEARYRHIRLRPL